MAFNTTPTIAQMSAVKAAAEITAAMTTAGILKDEEAVNNTFDAITEKVFLGITTLLEAEATAPSPQAVAPTGAGYPATFVVSFGKHTGKTLAQIRAAEPSYINYLAEKAKKQDVQAAAIAFLAAPATAAYLGG